MTYDPRDLDQHPAYQTLAGLARHPVDLTQPEGLTPERLASLICRGPAFDLLYATQRVDERVLDGLQALADQSGAVDQFLAMQQGEVMNRLEGYESEERQVLHTASRDLFSEPPRHAGATARAREQLAGLGDFLADLESGRLVNHQGRPFTDLIQIGIGGSDLGPRALYLALRAFRHPARRVHFIANVDPDDAAAVLRDLDPATTLVNVVSKSGTTLETLTNETLVREWFRRAGLAPERHFLAVTGQGSPMDDPARYLRSFHMFDYIGGRYSATSMVGAVMLAFGLGLDPFMEILRGANEMDRAAEARDIRRNLPLLMALLGIWNRDFLGCHTLAILPYSQGLVRFTAHLQQCDMESNGKSVNRRGEPLAYQTGPIVWGEPGTNGQHAFYQLLHQGTTAVPVEFIGFRRSQYEEDLEVRETTSQEKLIANLLAQAIALATGQRSPNPNRAFPGNRPSLVLLGDRLTPRAMGSLLACYEAKIAFQGFIWNINSFDQEGVQLGKVLADRLLDHFKEWRRGEPADTAGDPLGWALLEAGGFASKSGKGS